MNPKYGYGPPFTCCTGNVHQGWPKFIMSGVQAKHGLGSSAVVISGYSPYTATLGDGTTVQIGGQYPFADNATISVTRAKAGAAWSLTMRIPCWADSVSFIIAGKPPVAAIPCKMFEVPAALLDPSATKFDATIMFQSSIKVVWDKWTRNASDASKTTKKKQTSKQSVVVTSASGRMHKSDILDDETQHSQQQSIPNKTFNLNSGRMDLKAVEIHRGPLVYTFPIPGLVNTTVLNVLNASYGMVHNTYVKIDTTKPYMYALMDPNASDAFVWNGFNTIGDIPFDISKPLATITAKARQVTDSSDVAKYAKGHIPGSPVPAVACASTVDEITLIPLANSYLRFTVLPWLGAEKSVTDE